VEANAGNIPASRMNCFAPIVIKRQKAANPHLSFDSQARTIVAFQSDNSTACGA
jgi:hypothetical protein